MHLQVEKKEWRERARARARAFISADSPGLDDPVQGRIIRTLPETIRAGGQMIQGIIDAKINTL